MCTFHQWISCLHWMVHTPKLPTKLLSWKQLDSFFHRLQTKMCIVGLTRFGKHPLATSFAQSSSAEWDQLFQIGAQVQSPIILAHVSFLLSSLIKPLLEIIFFLIFFRFLATLFRLLLEFLIENLIIQLKL